MQYIAFIGVKHRKWILCNTKEAARRWLEQQFDEERHIDEFDWGLYEANNIDGPGGV